MIDELHREHRVSKQWGALVVNRICVAKCVNLGELDPSAEIARCLLEAQRQMHRIEEIVCRLAAPPVRDNLASIPAVALLGEGSLRLKRELDEFELDSLALLTIARSSGQPQADRERHRPQRSATRSQTA